MPYHFHWHDEEQTIIRIDVVGDISWEQWHEAIDKVMDALANSSHRIDLIFNNESGMPRGNAIRNFKVSLDKMLAYSHLGLVVTVNVNQPVFLVKAFVGIMLKAYKVDIERYGTFFDTLDEALGYIRKDRTKSSQMIVESGRSS